MRALQLKRFAYTPIGTFGTLYVDGQYLCLTVERPWRDNQPNVSCIPEGQHTMRKRTSNVVGRSSGGRFTEGWEICDVIERTFIMFHVANTMDDLEGCVGVGSTLGSVKGRWAVLNSRDTFIKFMEALDEEESCIISITSGGVYP